MTEEDKIPLPFIYYLHTNKKGFQHITSDIAGKSCLCVCVCVKGVENGVCVK